MHNVLNLFPTSHTDNIKECKSWQVTLIKKYIGNFYKTTNFAEEVPVDSGEVLNEAPVIYLESDEDVRIQDKVSVT